jgi:hypothetical protein
MVKRLWWSTAKTAKSAWWSTLKTERQATRIAVIWAALALIGWVGLFVGKSVGLAVPVLGSLLAVAYRASALALRRQSARKAE